MIDADTYVSAVVRRLEQACGQVRRARVGPVDSMIGDFYEGSLIARGHIHFTVVIAPLATVNGHAVRDFARHVHQWAIRSTHQVPGGRTEVVNFAALVSPQVHPDAVSAAVAKPPLQAVGTTRPVVIDLTTGQVHTFTGTRFLGWALQDTIRAKRHLFLPPPAELAGHLPPRA
jgi:hypothetical protein